jgi:hypothetical protein
MKTQTLPTPAKSDTPALTNILVPLDFSSASNNAVKRERVMETTVESSSMAARLARHPFLAGMNQRQLATLADCATAVQIKQGQVIFQEGDTADRFYLIETGEVTLESSGGLGDPMLGWAWMFPPHVWTFTARAIAPITAVFLDGAILHEYCEKDHSFGYELLKRMNWAMYQRMQATRKNILNVPDRRAIVPRRAASAAYVELVPWHRSARK